jgi:hypothetical protein
MAAPTFHHALEQAELLARQALPTVLHERLVSDHRGSNS